MKHDPSVYPLDGLQLGNPFRAGDLHKALTVETRLIVPEAALEGIEVNWERIVYDRDGNLVEDKEFYSNFNACGNVWTVSPDMAGQSPGAS